MKRDPDAPQAAVRIMTVHGAKGLQAPIVVMADAAKASDAQQGVGMRSLLAGDSGAEAAGLRKSQLPEALAALHADAERKEAEESLRLLYVAMTRAEDYLFAGGLPARSGELVGRDANGPR